MEGAQEQDDPRIIHRYPESVQIHRGSRDTHTHTRDVHTVAHGTSTQSLPANPTTIPRPTETHKLRHQPIRPADARGRTGHARPGANPRRRTKGRPPQNQKRPPPANPTLPPPAPTEHYNRAPPHVCSKAVAASGFGITIGLTWNRLLSRRADSVSPLAGIGFFLRLGILAPTFV